MDVIHHEKLAVLLRDCRFVGRTDVDRLDDTPGNGESGERGRGFEKVSTGWIADHERGTSIRSIVRRGGGEVLTEDLKKAESDARRRFTNGRDTESARRTAAVLSQCVQHQ